MCHRWFIEKIRPRSRHRFPEDEGGDDEWETSFVLANLSIGEPTTRTRALTRTRTSTAAQPERTARQTASHLGWLR